MRSFEQPKSINEKRDQTSSEGWKKEIEKLFEQFPKDRLERDIGAQERLQGSVDLREQKISDQELLAVLGEYGVSTDDIEPVEGEGVNDLYRIKVKKHFSSVRIPVGYGYRGGAARALLLRNLGIDSSYEPRDIDVVRLPGTEERLGQDEEVAKQFMSDDFEHGHGVEVLKNVQEYFSSRDLTINEVLATDMEILLTKTALLDSVRHILRVTPFERHDYSSGRTLGPKMLSKLLRFYSESIHRYGDAELGEVEDWEYEENFISPFWLALQLDRALEVNAFVAEQYILEVKRRNLLPEKIQTVQDAVDYFSKELSNGNFYFRHAPVQQFVEEYERIGEAYERLPKRMGHGRSRGEE